MSGFRAMRERVAEALERDIRNGRAVEGEERRFLLRFRTRARGAASGAGDAVAAAFRGILRQKHPGTEWSSGKGDVESDDLTR